MSKTFGQRRNWTKKNNQWVRDDPMLESDPAVQQAEARRMVQTTVHGAAVAQQCDVPVLDIVGFNDQGATPSYVQREINKNLDQLPPTKDGGKVTKEILGDEVPLGADGALPDAYAEAFADALEKLWRNGAVLEDIQPGNVYFRTIEFSDGRPPRIEAGISDPDRIDWFANPRQDGGVDNFLHRIEQNPHGMGVRSRDQFGAPLNSAEEAMLAFLEHRQFLIYASDFGAFASQWIPFHILRDRFDNLQLFPGQSSELSPSIPKLVPFPGRAGPQRKFAELPMPAATPTWRMAA